MRNENVFDPEMIRRAIERGPSTSPVVRILTGTDRPLTASTIEIAQHEDGTFTVLREDIKP